MKTKWQIICENLQKTLKSGDYKVWISPLDGRVESNTVHIIAASAYVCDWLERRFSSRLREAAADVLGISAGAVQLTFSVREAVQASPKKTLVAVPEVRRASLLASITPPPVTPPPITTSTSSQAETRSRGLTAQAVPVVQGQDMQVSLPIPAQSPLTRVRWRYDFDDFVVGPTNSMAAAAAQDICRQSSSIETLFVSSNSGLGKTHLIHAIGQSVVRKNGQARVGYLTAEDFTTHFVRAARQSQMDDFKASLRNLDVLLLEDVHLFQGKAKTQNEALATIKFLQSQGSRVVLTSSFTPKELKNVDGQLVSHFCSGLLTHIDKPTNDMCRSILQQKAHAQNMVLPSDAADLLVEHLHEDVRQLESCLNNLLFKARHMNKDVSFEMAMDVLSQFAPSLSMLDLNRIISLVCSSFSVTEQDISSKSRRKEFVLARDTIYYLARKHTISTLEEIGARFNRRHSTVVKGISTIERQMQSQTSAGRQVLNTVKLVERNANP